MHVTFIRHSITDGNMASIYQGHLDYPLCDEGIELARNAPNDPAVRKVFTSHLSRTIQTAEILYPNAEIIPDPGLAEMHFGRFEGRSWKDMGDDPEYSAWVDSQCELPCPDGESKAGFTQRCRHAFRKILAAEAAAGSGNLHLVVHSGTLMAVLSGMALPERPYFEWRSGNCGGYLLECASLHSERPLHLVRQIASPAAVEYE